MREARDPGRRSEAGDSGWSHPQAGHQAARVQTRRPPCPGHVPAWWPLMTSLRNQEASLLHPLLRKQTQCPESRGRGQRHFTEDVEGGRGGAWGRWGVPGTQATDRREEAGAPLTGTPRAPSKARTRPSARRHAQLPLPARIPPHQAACAWQLARGAGSSLPQTAALFQLAVTNAAANCWRELSPVHTQRQQTTPGVTSGTHGQNSAWSSKLKPLSPRHHCHPAPHSQEALLSPMPPRGLAITCLRPAPRSCPAPARHGEVEPGLPRGAAGGTRPGLT